MAYRFSPSPTGKLHLGSIRTAVVSYIMAQKASEKFFLRIEDTDSVRSHEVFEREIYDTLGKLGIKYDAAVVKQSNSYDNYKTVVDALISHGYAYYCSCSIDDLKEMKRKQILLKTRIGYEGVCRNKRNTSGAVRLNVKMIIDNLFSTDSIHFDDMVFGSKTLNYRDVPDAVLVRADGNPTYLLANTVDDFLTGITTIVRGADLLPQTFPQILLMAALENVLTDGVAAKQYAHLPLMLSEDGEKISKRNSSTKSVLSYIEDGAFPNAIIQFVLSVGNSSIRTDSPLSLEEMVDLYDVTKTSQKNTKYLEHKLWHINKLHIKGADTIALTKYIKMVYNVSLPNDLVALLQTRFNSVRKLAEHGKKMLDSFCQFAEEKQKVPSSIEELREYRRTVFNNEPTPPLEELIPVLNKYKFEERQDVSVTA